MQVEYDETAWEALKVRARTLGTEHGKSAASWYFDGNTSAETYQRVLAGITDGNPEILDTFPSDGLSGEWADGYSSRDLERELGVENDEGLDELADAYSEAFSSAVHNEIERAARYQVA